VLYKKVRLKQCRANRRQYYIIDRTPSVINHWQSGESQLQIDYLKSRNCDVNQGFCLSKLIAESDWISLLIRKAQTGQVKGK
jgi:hypothetical protein